LQIEANFDTELVRLSANGLAKRTFDIAAASVGLVLISPLLAVLGILIKLDSPGAVFYRGIRAGRFGKPFLIFKLRTMVSDAEKRGGAETAADDPRITLVGHFLRRYKLDEFPQLLNVVVGQMSLVGPRPEVMEEVVKYNTEEQELLLVRPGITDRASIRFRWEQEILRGASDPHATYHEKIRPEKIRLGREYVRNNSILNDIKIIFQTLKVILD
jgi:lipopolysaccharide/colanic/teichoic acid biosynthesis glycosyltransferase